MSFPVQAEAHGGFFSGTLGTLKEWKLLFVEEVEWTLMLDGNSLGPVKKQKNKRTMHQASSGSPVFGLGNGTHLKSCHNKTTNAGFHTLLTFTSATKY